MGASGSGSSGGGAGKGTYGTQQNIPSDVTGLRGDVIGWLRSQGAANGSGGSSAAADAEFEQNWAQQRTNYANQMQANGLSGGQLQQAMAAFENGKAAQKQGFMNKNPQGSYGQIFNQTPATFSPTSSANTTIGDVAREAPTTIGPIGNANYQAQTAGNAAALPTLDRATTALNSRDPAYLALINSITGKANSGNLGVGATAGNAGSTVGMVQSMDQLAGQPNQYFQNQVLSPYKALFNQNRGEAIAAANEGAGNLTGSGFANTMGTTINRSLTDENKTLSDILTQLSQSEIARQQQVADREQGRLTANAGFDTQASIATAGNRTQGNIAGINSMADLAKLFSNEGMDAAGRADRTSQFNATQQNAGILDFLQRSDQMNQFNTNQTNNVGLQQSITNAQNETQRAVEQGRITSNEAQNYYNQLMAKSMKQGEMDQNNNQFNSGEANKVGMFNAQNQTNVGQQNAANFLQMLLGMTTTGVGPSSTTYKPGAWDAFSQILPFLGQAAGSYYGAKKAGG